MNETIFAMAEIRKGKQIEPFSQSWGEVKFRLLEHVLRASNEDPMRRVVFEKDTYY